MSRYFFLGSILPPLQVGREPGIHFEEFIALLKDNLSPSDFEKVCVIRKLIDLKNVQKLLKKEPLDRRGNFSEKELDEAFVNQVELPDYLFEHLEKSEGLEEQLLQFSKVFITFFKEMEKKYSGFLQRYFAFEREWRLLLTGYRAKKLRVDPATSLQHEDFHDPLVVQILAQKDAPFFEFPFEYEDLGEKLKDVVGNPEGQYLTLAKYRFDRIGDQVQDHPFSLDYLLGYLVQLMIVEDAFALNKERGNESLQEIVKGNI